MLYGFTTNSEAKRIFSETLRPKKKIKQPTRKTELSFYSIYTISDKTIVIERYGQIKSNQNKIEF